MGVRVVAVLVLAVIAAAVLQVCLVAPWGLGGEICERCVENPHLSGELTESVQNNSTESGKSGAGIEKLKLIKLASTNSEHDYLALVEKCSGLALREGQSLILKYRFALPTFFEAEGGDVKAEPGNAYLLVSVTKQGELFVVNFTLKLTGEALGEHVSRSVDLTKTVILLYDGSDYYLPNRTRIGMMFPLLIRKRELRVSFLWARPGENHTLKGLREITARMDSLVVWDLKRRLAVTVNASTGKVVNLTSLERLPSRYVREVVRRAEVRANLSGCPHLITAATYSSGEAPFYVTIDYALGIPTFIVVRGAQRTLADSSIVWQGKKLEEVPASPLAVLLGIRSDLVLELELIQVKG